MTRILRLLGLLAFQVLLVCLLVAVGAAAWAAFPGLLAAEVKQLRHVIGHHVRIPAVEIGGAQERQHEGLCFGTPPQNGQEYAH